MRIGLKLLFVFSALMLNSAAPSWAAEGAVLGFSADIDELELYKTPTDDEPAHIVGPGDMSFPTPILARSNNGMYKINHKGRAFWVISDDVESDSTRKVDSACDPKMAGTMVAHGKRGAKGDCK